MRKSRIETDPELAAAMEGAEERFVERIKQGYRDRLEREAREERRRARLRRLTFGLLGR
ncbi:MAG: hypothetical protein ACYC1P_14720 [Gaiellaceae bacterium]